ncbi:hypothetical protein CYY_008597 [Polysphondylium violaceum]|uniref:Amidinotransferase n=1 Tax=Polysphondylium violaceum TaxID=133409 RepID=A0A8J4PMX1_9MYCE|nr:hypothetical protein CYY_008597 [Polysphondylium violaceum]
MTRQQSSNSILMVQPTNFELNVQAVADNYFMNKPDDKIDVPQMALKEFTNYYNAIKSKGVDIQLFKPADGVETPDCLFPNNWFSTHSKEEMDQESNKETLCLYPMCHLNRRLERRPNIIEFLKSRYPADQLNLVDLTESEKDGIYLEGTGSFVLDRVNRNAYICISQRSHKTLAMEWAQKMGYNLVSFTSVDAHGKVIYHTNVIMAICSKFAVICLDSVEDVVEKQNLISTLSKTHTIIDITKEQVNNFCGNVIEVVGSENKKYLVASTTAWNAFTEKQQEQINQLVDGVIAEDIPTIQSVGGGGIRCMIAELF